MIEWGRRVGRTWESIKGGANEFWGGQWLVPCPPYEEWLTWLEHHFFWGGKRLQKQTENVSKWTHFGNYFLNITRWRQFAEIQFETFTRTSFSDFPPSLTHSHSDSWPLRSTWERHDNIFVCQPHNTNTFP